MSGEDIKTKVCSKCGKELPMTDEYFYKRGDRYQSQCKECVRKRCKKYYETHKDEAHERQKEYCKTHKDQKRERQKEYRETHKGQMREYARKYYEAHKEKRCRDYYAKRRFKRNEFFANWKKPCQKCGEQRLYLIQFHHIDPTTKEFDISTSVPYKKTEICEEEAKKCVCLCSNCHDEFHYFYGKHPKDPVNAIKEYLKE